MKWITEKNTDDKYRFEIIKDSKAGYYLYVWEGDTCVFDDLQDTLEWSITVAHDEYGVPKDAWRQVD